MQNFLCSVIVKNVCNHKILGHLEEMLQREHIVMYFKTKAVPGLSLNNPVLDLSKEGNGVKRSINFRGRTHITYRGEILSKFEEKQKTLPVFKGTIGQKISMYV
jgi:hypothetical protein